MGLRAWLSKKLDMPAHRRARAESEMAWDRAQATDLALLAVDPDRSPVEEACGLLDHDPVRAFDLLLTLADEGSAWSMVNLGWCCEVGRGVSASLINAEDWYRQAHEAGSDYGLLEYGRLVVERRAYDLAKEAYAIGAARGWAPAMYHLARLRLLDAKTRQDRVAVQPLLERAAKAGSPAAQFLLAKFMVRGWFGLRHVATGLGLVIRFIRARLAEIDRNPDVSREDGRPAGVTLH